MLNGVIMLSFIRQMREPGYTLIDAILSSTLLTLRVLPALYQLVWRRAEQISKAKAK